MVGVQGVSVGVRFVGGQVQHSRTLAKLAAVPPSAAAQLVTAATRKGTLFTTTADLHPTTTNLTIPTSTRYTSPGDQM